mmetsp:Transcript_22698/g.57880  ORF Transcript_22698/g.57880 Transcript_22698/m.57880 type:complete len:344 (+) Transcript_22698:3-1034(+)
MTEGLKACWLKDIAFALSAPALCPPYAPAPPIAAMAEAVTEVDEVNVTVDAQGGAPKALPQKTDQKPTTPEEEIKELKTKQEKNTKAIALLQNPRLGAKGEELAPWQQLFIKMITPKLVSFDRPFLVATVAFVMSMAIAAVILWAWLNDCTVVQTTNSGAMLSQMKYTIARRAVGVDICLQGTSFFTSTAQGGPLVENLCMPEDAFTNLWPVETVEAIASAEDHNFNEALPWCEGGNAQDVARKLCELQVGGSGQCPVCSGSSPTDRNRHVFNVFYEETTCKSVLKSVYWTLCFTNYLELVTTFFIVVVLMATGALKQYGPTGEKMGFAAAVKNDWGNKESLS